MHILFLVSFPPISSVLVINEVFSACEIYGVHLKRVDTNIGSVSEVKDEFWGGCKWKAGAEL